MSKAVLVIDMPKRCGDCPCFNRQGRPICPIKPYCGVYYSPYKDRAPWCSLIEVDEVHSRAGNWLLPKGLFDKIYESEEE